MATVGRFGAFFVPAAAGEKMEVMRNEKQSAA
jgi:hypothetical protein